MDALHKYKVLTNQNTERLEQQKKALESQVSALASEKINLTEMQQIMQMENDTNMQTIQDLVKEINLLNEQKVRMQRIIQNYERSKNASMNPEPAAKGVSLISSEKRKTIATKRATLSVKKTSSNSLKQIEQENKLKELKEENKLML